MSMRLVLRGREPRWLAPVLVLVAVVIVYLLTAGPIRGAGANPQAAYQRYIVTPLTQTTSLTEVVLAAIPILFTGLAVAVAFRSGYWNIGAEGQFLAGAIGATAPGLYLPNLPGPLAIPLALVAGALAGVLWSLVPALLRTRYRIDEVVTTLLLNPVALLLVQGLLNGPWRNSTSGFPVSNNLGAGYRMPLAIPGSRVHLGVVIAAVLAIAIWLVMSRTATGLRARAVGLSPDAARFSGISVRKTLLRSALISGAIAGLGGADQVLGVGHKLSQEVSSSYGYTGIVVATLGALTAGGVVLVALLLGDITVGAQNASLVLQLPPQMGEIVSSLLMLAVISMLVLRRYKVSWRRDRSGALAAADAPGGGGAAGPPGPPGSVSAAQSHDPASALPSMTASTAAPDSVSRAVSPPASAADIASPGAPSSSKTPLEQQLSTPDATVGTPGEEETV
ncbi:MAG: ABC transporter permease [Actinobacteria bacterium 69-20]|mgnify:CR=1 FL=1|jgi:simple sugar transport system permease protein|nr:MAG: ABC transporter permease [Actinobacteria bacterium 69-20]